MEEITNNLILTRTESDNSFLKNARDIAFVIAVYLYFMGWVYVYYYLRDFGISIRQVDIDFYNLITYAIDVVLYASRPFIRLVTIHWIWTLFSCFAVIGFIISFQNLIKRLFTNILICVSKKQIMPYLKYFSLMLLAGICYALSVMAAYHNKNRDQIKGASKLHTITFEFKESKVKTESLVKVPSIQPKDSTKAETNTLATLIQYSNDSELRLLFADKETYYVFRFDPTVTWDDAGSAIYEVFLIQREDVEYAKITN